MSNFKALTTKKARTAHIRLLLGSNEKWALKGLVRIYANQTADEKSDETTRHDNGVGFTGTDGHFMTSLAKQYIARGKLSEVQMSFIFRKMPKYARQLERVSK